jgi:transcriptional regulator with XRE-family HTH domain
VVFGRNLRRACKLRQLDPSALAKLIGRTQQTAKRMLAGRTMPGLAVIDDIARKLDVPLADLLRGL